FVPPGASPPPALRRIRAEPSARADRSRETTSVEVAELIVQAFVEGGVDRRRRIRRRRFAPARPSHGRQADHSDAAGPNQIGHEPREAVEPLIDRRRQRLLASELGDVVLDDLVVALALIDQARHLVPHRRGFAAVALGDQSTAARAAHANDVVLQLLFERAARDPWFEFLAFYVLRAKIRCQWKQQQQQYSRRGKDL